VNASLVLAVVPGYPDKHAPQPGSVIFTILCGGVAVAAICLALRHRRRRGDVMPLLFLASGGLTTFFEPLLDANGGVWYPSRGGLTAYTLVGIKNPWFVPLAYIWIYGGTAYLAYWAFGRRWSSQAIWTLVAAYAVNDIITEWIGVGLGAYGYYGHQPLDVLGLPMWYPIINSVGPLAAGAMIYVLRRQFTGAHTLALLGGVPLATAMTYAGAGWPMWLALQSHWSTAASYVTMSLSLLFGYLVVRFCLAITATPA
jgi:hypothetical protein